MAMLETLDRGTLRGLRDRAMLLIGFAGGLRRSEVVGLDVGRDQTEDGRGWVEILDKGMVLSIRGKTGWREVEIGRGSNDATCPVVALQTWLQLARIAHGPLFRRVTGQGKAVGADRLNDQEVARLVKRARWRPACAATCRRVNGSKSLPAIRCAPALLLGRGRRTLCPKATRPRLGRDDPPLSAPPRSVPHQPHQGGGAIGPLPCRFNLQKLHATILRRSHRNLTTHRLSINSRIAI